MYVVVDGIVVSVMDLLARGYWFDSPPSTRFIIAANGNIFVSSKELIFSTTKTMHGMQN